MKIWSVTPIDVAPEELARRQERYDRISPAGVSVHLQNIGAQAPRALESAEDVRASEKCVIEALSSTPAGYDAVMPDCVLDPGVLELQKTSALPVIGLLRMNLAFACALNESTSAVVRNDVIAEEMRSVSAAYGWSHLLTDIRTIHLDVEAIADHERWTVELESAAGYLASRGAARMINGCSAVDTDAAARLPLRVVDPVAFALRLVAAGA